MAQSSRGGDRQLGKAQSPPSSAALTLLSLTSAPEPSLLFCGNLSHFLEAQIEYLKLGCGRRELPWFRCLLSDPSPKSQAVPVPLHLLQKMTPALLLPGHQVSSSFGCRAQQTQQCDFLLSYGGICF